MPRNAQPPEHLEELPVAERKALSFNHQEHWYLLLSSLCRGRRVLDVGAGTGYGLPILRSSGASSVLGIDLLPAGEDVQRLDVSDLRSKSFDLVCSMDVIEHVEDDKGFLTELLRVATDFVFFATPNWNVWGCTNKYHVREYTPAELVELLAGREYCLWTCGKDRVAEPCRPITSPEQAEACFAVLLRGDGCSDELWETTRVACSTWHADVPSRLSTLTRNAEEWTSIARLQQTPPNAPDVDVLERCRRLLVWLQAVLVYAPRTPAERAVRDITVILRYGYSSPEQQAAVVSWALNTFVLGPTGPWVNQI